MTSSQLEESHQAIEDASVSTDDFNEKMKCMEDALKKIFGRKNVVPTRSQSLGKWILLMSCIWLFYYYGHFELSDKSLIFLYLEIIENNITDRCLIAWISLIIIF